MRHALPVVAFLGLLVVGRAQSPPSITVNGIALSPTVTEVAVGGLLLFEVTTSDPDGDDVSLSVTGLPSWLTATPALPTTDDSVAVSGQPTPDDVADDPFDVSFAATDDALQSFATVRIKVVANEMTPAFISPIGCPVTTVVATAGGPVPLVFHARDMDPKDIVTLTLLSSINENVVPPVGTAESLPTESLLNVSFMAPNTPGTSYPNYVKVEARDNASHAKVCSITLVVRSVECSVSDVPTEIPFTVNMATTTPAFFVPGPPDAAAELTLSVEGLPSGATTTSFGTGAGFDITVSWTPGPTQGGDHLVNFKVSSTDADGDPVTQECPVVFSVAECLMLVGVSPVSIPVTGDDFLYTVPIWVWPVTLTSIPVIPIPSAPEIAGTQLLFQTIMLDTGSDPLRASNGLALELGGQASSYGVASGMQLWAVQAPMLGGLIELGFSIDGFPGAPPPP